MRWLIFHNVFCLWPFLALHDFKFNVIPLLQAFITVRLDGAVVDEHIGAVFPTDEAETLCVIKPFHFAFNSRHVLTPSVLGHCRFAVYVPDRYLLSWVLPLLKEGRRTPEVPSPRHYVIYPLLWLLWIFSSIPMPHVNCLILSNTSNRRCQSCARGGLPPRGELLVQPQERRNCFSINDFARHHHFDRLP
jgi:hypothetical protein